MEHRLDADPRFQALPEPDRRLVRELVLGTIRRRATLDWLIGGRARGRLPTGSLADVLRVGLYQLFFLDRVPAHAAVHETVEAARALGLGPKAGFVNAVLRGCLRDADLLRRELALLGDRDPATAGSHPGWLVERWIARWGVDATRRLLDLDNLPPETFVRVNTLRISSDALRERWQAEGVESESWAADWTGPDLVYRLGRHPPFGVLGSFLDGGFYVQDPSTLLAVQLLDPRPGESVLDLCAAPGGKTTYLAQRMLNQGTVVAHDTHPERIDLLRRNCERLGAGCVRVAVPGTVPESVPGTPGGFDRVLVDAPCSNTGVLRRRVEARWRLTPESLQSLGAAQGRLLDQAAGLVRPGGVLVYSTCSLEPEENEGQVDAFLGRHPEFRLERQRTLTPFEAGVDGAHAARLVRVGTP